MLRSSDQSLNGTITRLLTRISTVFLYLPFGKIICDPRIVPRLVLYFADAQFFQLYWGFFLLLAEHKLFLVLVIAQHFVCHQIVFVGGCLGSRI